MPSFDHIIRIALKDIEQYVIDNMGCVAYLKEKELREWQATYKALSPPHRPSEDIQDAATTESEKITFSTRVAAYGLTSFDRWKWYGFEKTYNLSATREKVITAAAFLDDIATLLQSPFQLIDESETKLSFMDDEVDVSEVQERLQCILVKTNEFIETLSGIDDGNSIGYLDKEAKALQHLLRWLSKEEITPVLTIILNYEHENEAIQATDQTPPLMKIVPNITPLTQTIFSYLFYVVAELEVDASKVNQKIKTGLFELVNRHSAKQIKERFIYAITETNRNDRDSDITQLERLNFLETQVDALNTVCEKNNGWTTSISFVAEVLKQLAVFSEQIAQIKKSNNPASRQLPVPGYIAT